jgi:hypothetical protein
MGTGAYSLGVKWPGREADRSSLSSAEVKNAWSYTSTPQYFFMAWCLVKHMENFTFHHAYKSKKSLVAISFSKSTLFHLVS